VSKPYGLNLNFEGGGVKWVTTNPSEAENKIWEAVEEAIRAGMPVKRFINEAQSAWGHILQEIADNNYKEWPK
jgi:hypothetical protein